MNQGSDEVEVGEEGRTPRLTRAASGPGFGAVRKPKARLQRISESAVRFDISCFSIANDVRMLPLTRYVLTFYVFLGNRPSTPLSSRLE
jgi:hypothetical protein